MIYIKSINIIYGYEIEDIKNILLVTPGRIDIICISRTNLDKLISNYKDM